MDLFADLWNAGGAFLSWPWLAVCGILTGIGVVMTKRVFTAQRRRDHGLWWDLLHDTQTLHPILTGGLIGVFWRDPTFSGEDWPMIASMSYFGFAGFVSSFAWSMFVWWVKERTGWQPRLPGTATPIPDPPEQDAAPGLAGVLEPEDDEK